MANYLSEQGMWRHAHKRVIVKTSQIVFASIVLLCCNRNEHSTFEYYENGKVKREIETDKESNLKTITGYHPNGKVKFKQVRNLTTGAELNEEYDENGILVKKGTFDKANAIFDVTLLYEDGKIREHRDFDSLGNIRSVVRFKNNGTRDSMPFPFAYIVNGDTINRRQTAILRARIVNYIDSMDVADGTLIITRRLDSKENGLFQIRDTFAIINPFHRGLNYEFRFQKDKPGNDTIYGEFVFEKKVGKYYELTKSWIAVPIYVKE
jgi:hypothetical protein